MRTEKASKFCWRRGSSTKTRNTIRLNPLQRNHFYQLPPSISKPLSKHTASTTGTYQFPVQMSVLQLEMVTVPGSSFHVKKIILSSAVDPTYREGAELACYVTVNRDTSCVLMKKLHVISLRYFKFSHHIVDWQAKTFAFGGIRRTGEAWPSECYHLPCARVNEENHQTP